MQNDQSPDRWREVLDRIQAARAAGHDLTAQVAIRPVCLLLGLAVVDAPLHHLPHLPQGAGRAADLAERVARMREPEVRAALLDEHEHRTKGMSGIVAQSFHKMFPLGDPPDYEPRPEHSIEARAAAAGVAPAELVYDLLLQRDGRELLLFPLANFSDGNLEVDPGDEPGRVHACPACPTAAPTAASSATPATRPTCSPTGSATATRGERLPLEYVVQRQCRDTARQVGLDDRGTIEVGMLADLNVIDLDHLTLRAPEMVYDLPAGGRRLVQRAEGYTATIKRGQESSTATASRPARSPASSSAARKRV